jgi:hypothetical protein
VAIVERDSNQGLRVLNLGKFRHGTPCAAATSHVRARDSEGLRPVRGTPSAEY